MLTYARDKNYFWKLILKKWHVCIQEKKEKVEVLSP
jgi:hypothetical protein